MSHFFAPPVTDIIKSGVGKLQPSFINLTIFSALVSRPNRMNCERRVVESCLFSSYFIKPYSCHSMVLDLSKKEKKRMSNHLFISMNKNITNLTNYVDKYYNLELPKLIIESHIVD